MSHFLSAGYEPSLAEMLDDPIFKRLMASDGTDRQAVERMLQTVADRAEDAPRMPVRLRAVA